MNQQNQKRILIGTLCGGGQVTTQYMLSLIECFSKSVHIKEKVFIRNNLRAGAAQGVLQPQQLQQLAQLEGENLVQYELGLYTLSQESLLGRGRNHIAAVALRQGWDNLIFIDADTQWTWDQFRAVIETPYDFRAGAVPLKVLNQDGIHLNFLPLEDDENYFPDRIRSLDSLNRMKDGHGTPHVPVGFVGTAFMCLSRQALLKLAEVSAEYSYPNPSTGHLHTTWNIFDCHPQNGKFMSEDWSACQKWRDLGGQVIVNADVVTSHVGNIVYSPLMAKLQCTPKSIHEADTKPA